MDEEKVQRDKTLQRVEKIAIFLDGKGWFGWDPIIGLVPIAGDILPVIASVYMVVVAQRLGLPRQKLLRMIGWTVSDMLVGFVPVVGDVADFCVKSHRRNWRILREHFHDNVPP